METAQSRNSTTPTRGRRIIGRISTISNKEINNQFKSFAIYEQGIISSILTELTKISQKADFDLPLTFIVFPSLHKRKTTSDKQRADYEKRCIKALRSKKGPAIKEHLRNSFAERLRKFQLKDASFRVIKGRHVRVVIT